MRLLRTATFELVEFTCEPKDVPPYAILSHTWGEEEVTFPLFQSPGIEQLKGYSKIIGACEQARRDDLEFVWIDTCCIDKSSSSELSEAINSMFAWYRDAEVCYAYLSDVDEFPARYVEFDVERVNLLFRDFPGDFKTSTYSQGFLKDPPDEFASSRWWTRGWTLQELLAPREVIFYSRGWTAIGRKSDLLDRIALITGIDNRFLSDPLSLKTASVARIMSWAARRDTSRSEDQAYSLMGIFDVNMPLLYGEGARAFTRLQEEIMQRRDDHTLFAWTDPKAPNDQFSGLLAPNPSCFKDSRNYLPLHDFETTEPYAVTNKGIAIHIGLALVTDGSGLYFGVLQCTQAPDCEGFITIYLKRVARTAAKFSRVRGSFLGWTAKWRNPRRILVADSYGSLFRPNIWPIAVLALRRGPSKDVLLTPVQDLVSVQYRLLPETNVKVPFLTRPEAGYDAFDPELEYYFTSIESSVSEELSGWAQRARSWIPERFPLFHRIPNEGDLVSVAFELVLRSGLRILVMLGSNHQDEFGFDCRLLEKDSRQDLCNCGGMFRSKSMNRYMLPHKVDLGICVFEISIGVEFVNKTKIFWVDIQVKFDAV